MDPVTLGMAKASARIYLPRPHTIVYIGDSLTADGGFADANKALTGLPNRSYLALGLSTWAQALSGHRLKLLRNLGIGGQNTSQILARIGDALALKPGWVHELSGTNNLGTAELVAQAKLDKIAMWDIYERAGIRVITGTLPPSGTYSGSLRALLDDMNEWIRQQAEKRPNLVLVDYFAALSGEGGQYELGYNRDNTHTNPTGAAAAGRALADVIKQLVPPRKVLSHAQGDSANLHTAGRFSAGGDGTIPTLWSTNLAASAFSKETRTDNNPGRWQVVTVANGSSGYIQHNMPVGANLAVGDYVTAAIEFDISNLDPAAAAKTQGFQVRVQSYNGSTTTDITSAPYFVATSTDNFPAWARSGILQTPPIQVPAGTTILLYQVVFNGGGTYKIDRATVRNLTKLGLPTDIG